LSRGLTLVALLALGVAPPAGATVRSAFVGSAGQPGMLRVESDGADAIVVACAGGQVLVNGAAPDTGPLQCGLVARLEVIGGPGDNRIDLGGIRPVSSGPSRGENSSALIDGGAGDDTIVGPTGGLVRIVGGPGSDRMQTHASSIDKYVFEPAAFAERDTIVEPVQGACSPSYSETDQPNLTWWTVPWDAIDFTALGPDDPLTFDARSPDGVLASHRNRTIVNGGVAGIAFEAVAGGAGNDRIDGMCMALGGAGDDSLTGWAYADLLLGGPGADVLFGGGGRDKLVGDDGADRLNGGDGDDTLDGGRGNDVLDGWNQDDVYVFSDVHGMQTDTVTERPGRGGLDVLSFDFPRPTRVLADLSSSSGVIARAGRLVVRGDERVARALEGVIGGGGGDRMVGNDRANHFWSGGGTDYAAGGRGHDVYHVDWTASMPYGAYRWGEYWGGPFERAEPGRSVAESGRAFLRIAESRGGGFDTVDVADRIVISPGIGTRLEGQISAGVRIDLTAPQWVVRTRSVGALTALRGGARHLEGVRGTLYADTVVGNAAANRLEGRQGADRVFGGAGRDVCLTARDGDRLRGCEQLVRTDPDR
jgi:Ca2+-binding RTX toxin-like protein